MVEPENNGVAARFAVVPGPRQRITVDPVEFGPREMYHLMNAVIAPRPVTWVSTLRADGVPDLAPHSYTTVFSTDLPVVGFVSVGRKDSLAIAEATVESVLNIASLDLIRCLNTTAANFLAEEDEFTWAGLRHVESDIVKAPRAGEAPVSFETTDAGIIPIGNCFLILGQVVRVHVAVDIWRDGRIEPQLLNPVLGLAG